MEYIRFCIVLNMTLLCCANLMGKFKAMREKATTIYNNADDSVYEYLDTKLWKKTELRRMVYEPKAHKLVSDKINVFDFKYSSHEDLEPVSSPRTRRSVSVFGTDQRLRIDSKFVEEYPFSSVVRLENGCTGTLIWHQHVLTAAHCVHNHTHFNPPVHKLRVGFLNKDGSFDWVGASEIFVPPSWSKTRSMKYFNHDYAVIKLSQPHQRRWMPFGAQDVREDRLIQFAGYPSDKRADEMWYSICMVSQSHRHVFVNHCDAAPGMSGSGVYVYIKNAVQDRTVVGVFSSYVQIEGQKKENTADANVATRLTARKVERICRWIGAGTNCRKIEGHYSRRNYFMKRKYNR